MPLSILITLIFIGTASVIFVLLFTLIPRKSVLDERLEGLASTPAEEYSIIEKPLTPFQKFMGRLGANIPLSPKDYGKYMRMIIAAGIKRERLPVFMGTKILLAVSLPAAYLVFYGLPIEKSSLNRVLFPAIFAILGFLLPSFWLRRMVKKRQEQIFHDLPDVLDLLTVCVEAGLSIDAAMIKVCEDPHFANSPLVAEMKIALQETRAGKQRMEALRDMGERAMEEDLKALAAMLIQTEKLGTSLAQSLKVFSDSLRTLRRQRAEEAAAKVAIKLLFPLAFFIFPALLLVILGPAVIRIMRLFTQF